MDATFAVPGAQLASQAGQYRRLLDAGGRFLNHGGRPHAERAETLYRGVTFYCDMDDGGVEQDIRDGHRTVGEVLGISPRGFRAPHFGCYQKPEQLVDARRGPRTGLRLLQHHAAGLWFGVRRSGRRRRHAVNCRCRAPCATPPPAGLLELPTQP